MFILLHPIGQAQKFLKVSSQIRISIELRIIKKRKRLSPL